MRRQASRLPEESKAARAQCGVTPQIDNLDVTLTVEQNLLVFAYLYRIGRADRRAAIECALEMANLVDRRDSRGDKLSGGMRRRLLIARTLIHRPRLVLLDEPTVGLDPQVRQQLWALIRRHYWTGHYSRTAKLAALAASPREFRSSSPSRPLEGARLR